MTRITKELEAELGSGTAELNLWVGLYSEGVVAGVLRGEKRVVCNFLVIPHEQG